MDQRRVLYIGVHGEASDSRIMSLRAAGMEVEAVTASDEALVRAAEVRAQIVVVDFSADSSQARKIARAFGDDRSTRALPLVLIGVNPSEMTVTRSKVPKARAMFVVGASAGEVAAVVSRVPIVAPRTKRSSKRKTATHSRRGVAPKARAKVGKRPTGRG